MWFPVELTNNYLIRTQTLDLPKTVESDFDYKLFWPSIRVQDTVPSAILSCPSNLHHILFAPSDSIKVRLFLKSNLAYFDPIVREDQPQHFIYYQRNGFTEVPTQIDYIDYTLKKDEYIFIPYDHAYSLLPETTNTGVLVSCFLDASNLSGFKKALNWQSFVSNNDEFQNRIFSLASFDFKMAKFPSALQWKDYLNTLQDKNFTKTDLTTPGTSTKRRKRNSVKNDFKEWQELTRWNQLISKLVIPSCRILKATDIGRNAITLIWQSEFVPRPGDTSYFAFRLVICPNTFYFDPRNNSNSSCFSRIADSSTIINNDGERDDGQVSQFSVLVDNLQSNKTYFIKIEILYDTMDISYDHEAFSCTTLAPSPPSRVRPPVVNDTIYEYNVFASSTISLIDTNYLRINKILYHGLVLFFRPPEGTANFSTKTIVFNVLFISCRWWWF